MPDSANNKSNFNLTGRSFVAVALMIICQSAALAQSAVLDSDNDGVSNSQDNCWQIANSDQTDADGDGYGNICDTDLDNNLIPNFLDFGAFVDVFLSNNAAADFDANGIVNFLDFGIFVERFLQAPGPSGVVASAFGFQVVPAFTGIALGPAIDMKQTPSQPDRWYSLSRNGLLISFSTDEQTTESVSVLNIASQVDTEFEGGALSFTFDPDFASNGFLYVSYTTDGPNFQIPLVSRISRFETSVSNGVSIADPASEIVLFSVEQPAANHNGGNIGFGPDGMLFFGLGDGGGFGDPSRNGQNTKNLLATMLRLDVNVTAQEISLGITYKIPDDNPFASNTDCSVACPEIFAWGLRNPWRWSFDRHTGQLWAGDVGQNDIEEISLINSGGNYGWRCYEGNAAYNTLGCDLGQNFETPIHTYTHAEGFSVTGGFVYRGDAHPQLHGMYIFADYGSGTFWGLYESDFAGVLMSTGLSPVSFAQNLQGEPYVISLPFVGNAQIYRIVIN